METVQAKKIKELVALAFDHRTDSKMEYQKIKEVASDLKMTPITVKIMLDKEIHRMIN